MYEKFLCNSLINPPAGGAANDYTVIVASYDANDKFISAAFNEKTAAVSTDYTSEKISTIVPPTASYSKVFVWNKGTLLPCGTACSDK